MFLNSIAFRSAESQALLPQNPPGWSEDRAGLIESRLVPLLLPHLEGVDWTVGLRRELEPWHRAIGVLRDTLRSELRQLFDAGVVGTEVGCIPVKGASLLWEEAPDWLHTRDLDLLVESSRGEELLDSLHARDFLPIRTIEASTAVAHLATQEYMEQVEYGRDEYFPRSKHVLVERLAGDAPFLESLLRTRKTAWGPFRVLKGYCCIEVSIDVHTALHGGIPYELLQLDGDVVSPVDRFVAIGCKCAAGLVGGKTSAIGVLPQLARIDSDRLDRAECSDRASALGMSSQWGLSGAVLRLLSPPGHPLLQALPIPSDDVASGVQRLATAFRTHEVLRHFSLFPENLV